MLQIHELTDGAAYRVAAELSSGSVVDVPGCSGLVLPMDALWAKLDELGE